MNRRHLATFLTLMALQTLIQGISHAQPQPNQPNATAKTPEAVSQPAMPTTGELNPLFERYEGGSKEREAKLIRSLVDKFALLQTAVGAVAGGNKRGTHSTGFCLEGELEIYDQPKDNAWLQIGPFKKPLTGYQRPKVRIRFADASSKPQSNWVPDVRAISISFVVDGKRQDFSMNNDPVFTFGNLTDFNNFMSFGLLAGSLPSEQTMARGPAIMGIFKANPDLAMSVTKALTLGTSQQRKDVYAYHTENYHTGSAYSFGPNMAAKFSLVRCGGLPPVREKLPPDANDRTLVDRTTSVVNGLTLLGDDSDHRNEFGFELKVEILDVEKMKSPVEGKKLTAIDWVEDATLDWTAAGAPSYTLGKLTAIPHSIKSAYECEIDPGYDVNGNCWDELKPLGNINRARLFAERQSQRFRLQQKPATAQAPATFKRTQAISQGWTAKDRDEFWYLPQGSYIIPFDWFMALTDPETKLPLRDGLERFGFIHEDYEGKSKLNPAQLPIGMTKETPPGRAFGYLRGKGDWIGITCAACHVGAVTVNGTRYIIDGAPSSLDFQKFSLALENALNALKVESQFEKFRATLAKQGGTATPRDVEEVRQRLAERNTRSFFHFPDRQGNRTVDAGPGRTDAFGVILNEVASRALGAPRNATVASAPVSFPQVWDAPIEKWVQYGGLSNNAFTRNVGEVLGVFGDVILDPKSPDFLATTARFENLQVLEDKLRKLKAPEWKNVFGPFNPTEQGQIKRGEAIFARNCVHCHSRDPKEVHMIWTVEFNPEDMSRNKAGDSVGTDPLYFLNLKKSWSSVDTGKLKGTTVFTALEGSDPELARLFGPILTKPIPDAEKNNAIVVLAQTTLGISLKYMKEKGIKLDPNDPQYKRLTGGDLPGPPPPHAKQPKFKARSLDGIAFTGPYFHNGSVRTLRGVLSPEVRESSFYVGSTGYDQNDGGFENAGGYLFQANKPGNLNIGHDFAADLSPSEKEDLLMFLKSL